MGKKEIMLVIAVAILCSKLFAKAYGLELTYNPSSVKKLFVDDKLNVTVSIHSDRDHELEITGDFVTLRADPESIVGASFLSDSWICENFVCNNTIQLIGRFLGFGKIFIYYRNSSANSSEPSVRWNKLLPPLDVTVLRQDKLINKLFIIFVATVVTINYINFGCALELDVVKQVIKRPIGPAVGFFCQFVIMPLVSYGVGYLLFSDPVLRLGLFVFGSSPGGGASNMWTVLLGGNLNLSITMTFISTVAAFGTIPLWLFTLGQTILKDTNIVIPFTNIITSLVGLVVPISIGLLIQRFLPKVAARSKRLLAPICIILIIGIIVLAAVANTFMFYLLNWKMIVAASLSVWTGFLAGILVSVAFRFSRADVIAVCIETGIQNTGIAFVLLSYSLEQPVADMAAVVPVAGSIITPIPLFLMLCYIKIKNRWFNKDKESQTLKDKKDEYQSTKSIIDTDKGNENEICEVSSF